MHYDQNTHMFRTMDGQEFYSGQRAYEHEESLTEPLAAERERDREFRYDFMHHPEHLAPERPSLAWRVLTSLGNTFKSAYPGLFPPYLP